jgi:hypothetical protein
MATSESFQLGSNWSYRLFLVLQYKEVHKRFRLPLAISAGIAGIVVFLLGLAIAKCFGLSKSYLFSPTVHLTWFAIAWVLGSVRWGLERLPKVLDDLATCFYSPGSHEHAQFIKKWMTYFTKNSGMLLCATLLFIFGALAIIFELKVPVDTHGHIIPMEWRSKGFFPYLTLVYYLGLTASLAGGAGFWLFLVNLPLLGSIFKRKTIPLPAVVLAKLRTISDFYVVSTFAWFVGVAAAVTIAFKALSPTSIGFLIISSIVGLSAFVGPQIIFHILLVRAQQVLADASAREYYRLISMHLAKGKASEDQMSLSELARLNSAAQGSASWVYDASDIVFLVASNLVPPITLIIKTFFSRP